MNNTIKIFVNISVNVRFQLKLIQLVETFESNSTKSCIDKKIPRIITFLKSQKNKGKPKLINGGE